MAQAIRTRTRAGDKRYQLTAIAPIPLSNGMWLWQCGCGNTVSRPPSHVRRGDYRSCGCQKLTHLDYYGLRFGRLRFVESVPGSDGKWLLQCDCGGTTTCMPNRVYNGEQVSCGCYRDEILSASVRYRNTNGITAAARKRNRMHPLRLLFELPKKLTHKGTSRWGRHTHLDGQLIKGAAQDSPRVKTIRRMRDVEAA